MFFARKLRISNLATIAIENFILNFQYICVWILNYTHDITLTSFATQNSRMAMEPSAKKAKVSEDPEFPIDLSAYQRIAVDPWTTETLSADQQAAMASNIELCRNAIVTFTACGAASGYGGHTGGAFDTVPEVAILDSFFRGRPDKFVPIFFDEAGHRVATQYLKCAMDGDIPASSLRNYRKGHAHLPGHPELGLTPGIKFSSGRLGHMWPAVNGVAMAHPDRIVCCLGSDGSQMEGNDAEAARLAVAQNLNVKLFLDDNDGI